MAYSTYSCISEISRLVASLLIISCPVTAPPSFIWLEMRLSHYMTHFRIYKLQKFFAPHPCFSVITLLASSST